MRIIGLDLGERRIGVAAADDRTGVAVPVTTVQAESDPVAAVISVLSDQGAEEVVVGLPLSMSGAVGPQAEKVLALVEAIQAHVAIPVHTWDERLSSYSARELAQQWPRQGEDALAATVILDSFLAAQKRGESIADVIYLPERSAPSTGEAALMSFEE